MATPSNGDRIQPARLKDTADDYLRWINVCLAFVHFTSTFGIWAYGRTTIRDRSKTSLGVDISPWYSLDAVGGCTEADFAKDSQGPRVTLKHYSVDLLDLCISFTVISGAYHTFIAVLPSRRLLVESWFNPFRWLDYGLSTPLMGAVLYLSYGIDDFNAVLAQGAGFVALQCIGASIELINMCMTSQRSGPTTGASSFNYRLLSWSARILLLFGFGVLGALFSPLFRSMQLLRKKDREGTDDRVTTSPPAAVIAFTGVLFAFYALFGAVSVYSYYLASRVATNPGALEGQTETSFQYRLDKLYGACSAMAKTVLHWALALVVLGQDDMVTDTRFADPHIRCAAESTGVGNTQVTLTVVTLSAIALGLAVIFVPRLPGSTAQGSTSVQLSLTSGMSLLDNYM